MSNESLDALSRLVADLETNSENGAPDYAHEALRAHATPSIRFGLRWPGWRWWLARVVRGDWKAALVGLYARKHGDE